MIKEEKNIIFFIVIFVVSYFIVGYVWNEMFVAIDWIDDVTIWQKLREYYIRSFAGNVFPTLILSIFLTYIISKVRKRIETKH